MNLYTGFLAAALIVASYGGTLYLGVSYGEDKEIARASKTQDIVDQAQEAMVRAAATAIATIKPEHVTVNQKVQREIQTNTVYRDCVNTPSMLDNINQALTGRAPVASDSQLPGPSTPARPDFWGRSRAPSGPGLSIPRVPSSSTGPANP